MAIVIKQFRFVFVLNQSIPFNYRVEYKCTDFFKLDFVDSFSTHVFDSFFSSFCDLNRVALI